jgi:hypothetical protein
MNASGPQVLASCEIRCLGVDQLAWAVKLTIRISASTDAVIASVLPIRIMPPVSCGDSDRPAEVRR